MKQNHKIVRDMLRRASRVAYDKIIRAAKLSPLETSCMDDFILNNRTQYQIAVLHHISERSVRLHLEHSYNKIFNCRLFADFLTDKKDDPCYAISIRGLQNVRNGKPTNAIFATGGTAANSSAAVYGTMAFGGKLSGNADSSNPAERRAGACVLDG